MILLKKDLNLLIKILIIKLDNVGLNKYMDNVDPKNMKMIVVGGKKKKFDAYDFAEEEDLPKKY